MGHKADSVLNTLRIGKMKTQLFIPLERMKKLAYYWARPLLEGQYLMQKDPFPLEKRIMFG